MSVQTDYDDMRDRLREDLDHCLEQAQRLVIGKDIWGFADMKKGYAMEVYVAIQKAIDTV